MSQLIKLKDCFGKIKFCRNAKVRSRSRNKRSRKSKRCSHYEIFAAGSSNGDKTTFFNPIIFKRERGLRALGPNGTFWLSNTPEQPFTKLEGASGHAISTWAKLRYAVRKSQPKKDDGRSNSFFDTLFTVLKKRGKKSKRTTKWVDFYFVNTRLDENIAVANQQFDILYNYLISNVLKGDYPDTPVVLTTGSNSNIAKKLAEVLSSSSPLQNSMVKSRYIYNKDSTDQTLTLIYQKGLSNLFAVKTLEDLQAQFAAFLFQ